MSVQLPNGVILSLATTYGTPRAVSAISNASVAVATATGHTLTNGAIIELTSGWQKLHERVMRVSGQASGTFNLEGMDTTNTTIYPAGGGAGSVREITQFTQLAQVLELSTSGGDMQFTTYSFLENDFESQLPTTSSAQSLTISIADDPTLAGYQALKKAADERAVRALRLSMPNGSTLLYNGYVSFNETPSMTKNQVMACQATFSLLSRPVRYAT